MDATGAFVLAGSVTMVWGFEDEADEYAKAILERMPDLQAHVPAIWPLEVANASLVGERRGRIKAADTARFIAILSAMPKPEPDPKRHQLRIWIKMVAAF